MKIDPIYFKEMGFFVSGAGAHSETYAGRTKQFKLLKLLPIIATLSLILSVAVPEP
jgi:hypothetical protein